MSALLDISVLVAALASDELKHAECLAILLKGGNCIYSHALLETFSTLTGGKLGVRVTADFAARMLSETVLPRVNVIELSSAENIAALATAQSRGVGDKSARPAVTPYRFPRFTHTTASPAPTARPIPAQGIALGPNPQMNRRLPGAPLPQALFSCVLRLQVLSLPP